MELFQQLKSQPLWYFFLLVIASFSILNSFYSILTRLYVNFRRPPTILTRPTDSASTSASASSTTADSVPAATVYEVFLSFHGEDTRKTFTDHLYTSLVSAGIHTFRDNDKLRVGKEIRGELLDAIKESKISIPIFSKNYASSEWCLLELEQMVKCHKNGGQKIFPIFYDVVPSDVRKQEGSYKPAFNLHKNNLHKKKLNKDTVQRWRDALNMVGGLKGWELEKETDGHEAVFVKKVVEKVVIELEKNYKDLPRTLVGMENHIKELMGLLEVDSDDVRIVGIHGMGGLGKTTMTKVIYNQMCNDFDGQCFFDDVRENSKDDKGIAEIQKSVSSVSDGRNRGKKLLLVLDDIDDYIQVDRLMEELTRFGARSRIILTTRNKEVLDKIEKICHSEGSFVVYKSYIPEVMGFSDSLQLFSKYAFKKDFPTEGYNILSKKVVSIAAGLPLALKVFGSTFFAFDKDLWKEKVKKLQRIPHKDVLKQLMFSFEALDDTEKEIFLDIACLYIYRDKTRPTYMWDACGLYPKSGISVLVSRSLIAIDDKDKFQMHDQLRDLGRHIDREEGLHGKQSRIWRSKEALQVLEINQETSRVKALRLAYDLFDVVAAAPHLPKLRYLSMWNMKNVEGDFKDLLPNLRWLECECMLDNSSLRNLNMKNLVVLHLSHNPGLTDDWDGWRQLKMANNLKVLDLSGCFNIQTFPNLSNSAKLVELYLPGCSGLTEIQGLEKLEFLQVLEISGCSSLRRLPNISSLKDLKVFNAEHCYELSQIEGLSGLISLEYLQLDGRCNSSKEGLGDLSKLNKLKVLTGAPGLDITDFSNFKHLKKLDIYRSNRMEIQKLDGLEALEDLEISDCSSIVRLPNLSYLNRLKKLFIFNCEQLIEIQDLSELKSLEGLKICFCGLVKEIPDLSPLHKLKHLHVYYCEKISDLSRLQKLKYLERLRIDSCRSVKTLPDLSALQKLKELKVVYCEKISDICGIEELKYLESLTIQRCRSVKTLPDLSRLQKLKELTVPYCEKISDIPGIEKLKSLAFLNIGESMGLRHLYDLDLPNVKIEPDKDEFDETYRRLERERRLMKEEKLEHLILLKNSIEL